jgi:hypothetical protein
MFIYWPLFDFTNSHMDNKDQQEFSLSRMILDTGLIERFQIPRGDSKKTGPTAESPSGRSRATSSSGIVALGRSVELSADRSSDRSLARHHIDLVMQVGKAVGQRNDGASAI